MIHRKCKHFLYQFLFHYWPYHSLTTARHIPSLSPPICTTLGGSTVPFSISSVNAFINVSANAARTKHTLRLNSGIPSSATFFLVIVVVAARQLAVHGAELRMLNFLTDHISVNTQTSSGTIFFSTRSSPFDSYRSSAQPSHPSFTTFFALGTDKALDWSNSAEPCTACAGITCSDGRITAIQNNYLVRPLPSLAGLASLQVLLHGNLFSLLCSSTTTRSLHGPFPPASVQERGVLYKSHRH
ncbi:hypothetical protein OPV22_010498 [Ensete ventricosum]|uniref:Leucine-rich repeat-containing N-terminal plant-type domain-containing protein n=1 Tax=Ensete ventricosum TaxID=4639 RepID=A0AAV8RKZ5_ENSVE|nr:hypothetical protein OPV22_010498 [Ensete ventricosum]